MEDGQREVSRTGQAEDTHEKKKHRRFYRAWQLGVEQTPQESKEEERAKEEEIRECGKRLQNILNAKVTILVMPSEDTGKQNKTKHKVQPIARNKEPGQDRRIWGKKNMVSDLEFEAPERNSHECIFLLWAYIHRHYN